MFQQQFSGGLTGDNIGVEYAGVVFAIAESPKQAGVIWAGTNDGLVQITQDGGAISPQPLYSFAAGYAHIVNQNLVNYFNPAFSWYWEDKGKA